MPIPKPKPDQEHDPFIEMCMGDDMMASEFDDEKQRFAVCQSAWLKEHPERQMMMPMKDQGHDDFMAACMTDEDMMADKPDDKNRQMACEGQWAKAHPNEEMKAVNLAEIERRGFDAAELRADAPEGQGPQIRGYAAMFDAVSEPMPGFREQIAAGAFAKSIKSDDVRALWNHNPDYVLGRTKAGTLRLAEDKRGLTMEIDPPDTQWARDAMESIRRGDVSQMSFGFLATKDTWEQGDGGKESIRTLREVKLFEVSPVTFPAYPQTSVSVRDHLKAIQAAAKPGGQGVPGTGRAGRWDKLRLRYGYKVKAKSKE